ncbi:unnamed protein product [Linum trigynum]|uniref:Gnk2-homologous domain-containing protein n=1 Tax=Linum trigynum TaxID=586398 RepID=A0AAV2G178_9ROSI
MAAAGGVASLMIVVTKAIIIVLLISSWDVIVVRAYDGTVREFRCNPTHYDDDPMNQEITMITNSLIRETQPGPPPASLCVAPDRGDDQPDVWGWAACAERLTKDDCGRCLEGARNSLMQYYCPGRAGAHVYRRDCSLQYETYDICNQ